jgi:addiction module HigA family antidote
VSAIDLSPIHPGEILRADFLMPLGTSQYRLAKAIRVPLPRVNDIVRGKRAITADTALRLARFFNTTPQLWLGFQAQYDLDRAGEELGDRLEREIEPLAVP